MHRCEFLREGEAASPGRGGAEVDVVCGEEIKPHCALSATCTPTRTGTGIGMLQRSVSIRPRSEREWYRSGNGVEGVVLAAEHGVGGGAGGGLDEVADLEAVAGRGEFVGGGEGGGGGGDELGGGGGEGEGGEDGRVDCW